LQLLNQEVLQLRRRIDYSAFKDGSVKF